MQPNHVSQHAWPRGIHELTSAEKILDETFLVLRSKLIDIAANLDRIDRAGGDATANHPRRQQIDQAIRMLAEGVDSGNQRAKRLQQLFSRPYEETWRRDFGV